jgi:hypothetical protein
MLNYQLPCWLSDHRQVEGDVFRIVRFRIEGSQFNFCLFPGFRCKTKEKVPRRVKLYPTRQGLFTRIISLNYYRAGLIRVVEP